MRKALQVAGVVGITFFIFAHAAFADPLNLVDPTDTAEEHGISPDTLIQSCFGQAGPHATVSNIAYGTFTKAGTQYNLYLDEYAPTVGPGPYPAALLIHGGGWVGGCRVWLDGLAATLATQGFIVFNMDYRVGCSDSTVYLCGYDFAVPPADVRTAMHWVRTHAQNYASFSGKVAEVGTSAGGNLAFEVGDVGISGDTKPDVVAGFSASPEMGYTYCLAITCGGSQTAAACDQAYAPAQGVCWRNTQIYVNNTPLGSGTPCSDAWAIASPACPANLTNSNPPPPIFIANATAELAAYNEVKDFQDNVLALTPPGIVTVCSIGFDSQNSQYTHAHGTELFAHNCDGTSTTSVDTMIAFLKAHL